MLLGWFHDDDHSQLKPYLAKKCELGHFKREQAEFNQPTQL